MMKYDKNFVNSMRKIGKIAAQVLERTHYYARPGITLNELDQIAADVTKSFGVESACLRYNGYPKYTCISVNDVMCHGLPDDTKLKEGDVVNIDVTVKDKDGHHGDTSLSFYIPEYPVFSPAAEIPVNESTSFVLKRLLVTAAKEAMMRGIEVVRPNGMTGDIGFATQQYVKKHRGTLSVSPDIGGHGIGKRFHMEPFVPAIGMWGMGQPLIQWTCLTVEPILTLGSPEYVIEDIPGSEVKIFKTKDKSLAAQFEHTVLVTDSGYEILTEL